MVSYGIEYARQVVAGIADRCADRRDDSELTPEDRLHRAALRMARIYRAEQRAAKIAEQRGETQ